MDSRHQQDLAKLDYSRIDPILIIMILLGSVLINTNDSSCLLSQKRQKQALRCRTYLKSTGILTCFPFLIHSN